MVTNASTSALIQQNQEAFKRLVAFAKVAEGLTIGFIQVNFAQDTNTVLAALAEHPDCQSIQFEVLTFADPNLKFLRKAILEALLTLAPPPHKKLIIIIRGLEQSIGMTGDSPPMLQDLNFIRDDLVASLPYPVLLCLPDYAITRLARYAPDFWAWKSGVFRFKSSYAAQDYAFQRTLNSARNQGSLDLPERRARIGLLQRLLMEEQPSGHQDTVGNLKNRLTILDELATLYRNQGDIDKAKEILEMALEQVNNQDDLIFTKASLLNHLGVIYTSQGELEKALSLYKTSLDIGEKIGDWQGNAATMHCEAIIYAIKGEPEKALSLYEKSLAIKEQIGNIQGKATTLYQMAGLYVDQGELEKALSLYEESLAIEEQIGDVQGKAANLHQIASIYASQGEPEQALSLYGESLALKERIGNVQGKAATLHHIAGIYFDRGEVKKALSLYEQSLEIEEQIGDVRSKAATMHQIAGIYFNQGDFESAYSLYEEALDFKEHIGDLSGKAATLAMMGKLLIVSSGNFEVAEDYLQKSLQIFQQIKSSETEKVEAILMEIQKFSQG